MGDFKFRVPVDWELDPYHANSIHVVGLDGVPWPCRISVADAPDNRTGKILTVSRNRDESGRLYLIYPLVERGEMLICTGTLPIRSEPYEMLTEIARGTMNRLRNQISIWEEGGLQIEPPFHERVSAATRLLGQAILCDDPIRGDALAGQSIEKAMDAIFELSDTFGEQIARFRREHDQMTNFWVATVVGTNDQFAVSANHEGFDLVEVCLCPDCAEQADKVSQANIEALGKRVIVGPWLDASVGGMSQRLVNLDDFMARKDRLLIDCRQQLETLPDSTSLIHVVSGLNGMGHRHLSYPQQLQVTVDMLRLVEESRIDLPTMVSFDFPWAERLAGAVGGVHPLQIADSILRQGVQVAFLGLDINLDYWPNGSAIRDPLQWIDLVDVWAQLGMPLVLCLRAPTGNGASPTSADRLVNDSKSNLTDKHRVEFLNTVLPMMVARPSVHGLIWRQWQDHNDLRFPNGGFVDAQGNQKPIADVVQKMRTAIEGP